MSDTSICDALILWLQTFPDVVVSSAAELADGVALARALTCIDADHFSAAWFSRLKVGCGDNHHLKVSNLRKVWKAVVEYLELQKVAHAYNPSPDVAKIAESGCPEQCGLLLQYVLGAAMNCPDKERYIQSMLGMPQEVQAVVMTTVQSMFMPREASLEAPASFHPSPGNIAKQLEQTARDRDEAVARVHELEAEHADAVARATELAEENARLSGALEGAAGGTLGRWQDARRKADLLQEELYRAETARDEYRAQLEALERERAELSGRAEELQRRADAAQKLQDELDALREMAARAQSAEQQLEGARLRLEEMAALKRSLKWAEAKCEEYQGAVRDLEEDAKKPDTWRPQLEPLKREVADLRAALAEQQRATDKLAFENTRLKEKQGAGGEERERLAAERDALKEQLEEARCARAEGGELSRDLVHSDLWEKLVAVKRENAALRKEQRGGADPVTSALYADLKAQHAEALDETRQLHQRIMELESAVEEGAAPPPPCPAPCPHVPPLEEKLRLKGEQVERAEERARQREQDMASMEERYKMYIHKAKNVIRTLDPANSPQPELDALRLQLSQRDRQIEAFEKEMERARRQRETEEKLMSSAFYNFGVNVHRQVMAQRLGRAERGRGVGRRSGSSAGHS